MMKIFQIVTLDIVDYNFKNKTKMKKSKAIELLKAETHSIKMDRREEKDVQLLNEILDETNICKIINPLSGCDEYYYVLDNDLDCSYLENPHLHHINISEIEVDEDFVNGEEVECYFENGKKWGGKWFLIGKKRDGDFVVEQDVTGQLCHGVVIRKPQTERDKAIQTIKELKEKFNIKNEEV
jgi:predicted nucleic acid-binding protein